MRFLADTRVYLSLVVLLAVGLRLAALSQRPLNPYVNIERRYILPVATIASGYGPLMRTSAALESHPEGHGDRDVIAVMERLDAKGQRIDRHNPYPPSRDGLIPATVSPLGYSVVAWVLYELFNYRGMILVMRAGQILLDSCAVLLIFCFGSLVVNRTIGRVAALIYALCPPAIFLATEFLPDGLHGFLTSAILTTAALGAFRSRGWLLVSGVAVGVACQFRSEYLLVPAVLFPVVLIHARPRLAALGWCMGGIALMLAILSPWAVWTHRHLGEMILTSTSGGATMYKALGEDTKNPWGIVTDDNWGNDDALARGFESQYSIEADRFYRDKWREYVLSYPGSYVKTVLMHRLPLALVPPYFTGPRASTREFSFTKYRREEGLSRWGVLRRYPMGVLSHFWPQILMLGYSACLMTATIASVILKRRQWPSMLWIICPWAYTVGTMILIKQHEPRNFAPVLVIQVVAVAIVGHALWHRRNRKRIETPSAGQD